MEEWRIYWKSLQKFGETLAPIHANMSECCFTILSGLEEIFNKINNSQEEEKKYLKVRYLILFFTNI
jgi:hypothetical protein